MLELTKREQEVFNLRQNGLSRAVIAERMGITAQTVDYYYKRIRQKSTPLDYDGDWDRVEVPASYVVSNRQWSKSAMDCLALNRNCFACPVYRHYDRHWDGKTTMKRDGEIVDTKCHMPIAVQILLDKKTPFPDLDGRRPFHKRKTVKNIPPDASDGGL